MLPTVESLMGVVTGTGMITTVGFDWILLRIGVAGRAACVLSCRQLAPNQHPVSTLDIVAKANPPHSLAKSNRDRIFGGEAMLTSQAQKNRVHVPFRRRRGRLPRKVLSRLAPAGDSEEAVTGHLCASLRAFRRCMNRSPYKRLYKLNMPIPRMPV